MSTRLLGKHSPSPNGSPAAHCRTHPKSPVVPQFENRWDGHKSYLDAIAASFHETGVDYAMLVKLYGEPEKKSAERRYSPAEYVGSCKERITGNPDEAHVSTSHVERHSLTMRMSMRRFTRLMNAFSKKIDNHCHAVSIYFVFYNFIRMHKTLRMSPAMAAGVSDRLWSWEEIIGLMDAAEQPKKRGPYKKRDAENSN